MYAVVETSGKQYQVEEGKYIDVDLIDANPDSEVNLEKVVAIVAGEYSQIGQPYVEGASIKGKILRHGKNKKVITFKMRQKKGYRVKQGHRQDFTRVLIENIEFPNKEETLNYAKEIDEKEAKVKEEQEAKLQKAKEKRIAKKEAKKTAKPKKEAKVEHKKPEIKEETKTEITEEVKEVEITQEVIEEEKETTQEVISETQEENKE